jgi:amino acid adenylation domain-containing protein
MQEGQSAGFWLSPQQKFAWNLQHAGQNGFRPACVISLTGPADRNRVRDALRKIASRHEILRTIFHRQTGMKVPFQVVMDDLEPAWECVDASAVPAPDHDPGFDKLWEKQTVCEPGSELGPALKAIFLPWVEGSFKLVLSLNPLCGDAQSLEVIARELATFYGNPNADLPEPFRYVQFAQWQGDLLESTDEDAQKARNFWAKQAELFPSLALPGEGTNDEVCGFAPGMVRVDISKDLASGIAREKPAEFLFAAWQCLLSRLCGRSSFRVGYLANGREYEELENAVGCFARTLPMPARIENDFRFSDVLRQTGAALRDAIGSEEYFAPESIGTDGELVSFSYQELGPKQTLAGVEFSLERVDVVSERYKLRLIASKRGSDLTLEFHYDASRLTESAVERIAGYYQNLVAAAFAAPETVVAKLPLLAAKQRRQLLIDWNNTALEYPRTRCLHQLFEQQAERTPDRIAARSAEQAFSYGQLNERANQLAHYLRALGVGPDRPVGLLLERSVEIMVAVLGIVKAGGAYVPLNPDNPPARLRRQLEGAAAVITESQLAERMPEFSGPVVVLDRDGSLWANQPQSNPTLNTTPENLVYILYTSGSTGVPKGVGVRHRNLVNYSHFIAQRLKLENYRDGLQFATVSTLGADLGNTSIYPALISGGTLHVIPYEMSTDPQRFAAYLAEHPMDVLKIVPSHLQALLHSEEARRLLPRKYLIFGGETLTPRLLEKVEALNPACEILNHYGPTETTVGSLTLQLNKYDWKSARLASIPIGKPIANTQVYILDQNLEPVPIGVTGELYIAGAGVSAGYLGQPEKTAERFVGNPFAADADSSARMYRTGDLARYGEDGNLEFLGRIDDQVKVRGFRIELGEIEAALARHSAVKQAVVVVREDEKGDKRLLAYVVLGRDSTNGSGHTPGQIAGEELRAHLKQQLPDYMMPQAVVILRKLPLTGNGKIDRQALPEPDQAATKAYIAPRTETEQAIAEIWAEVLRRPATAISIDDNFFDLGGHSLLATQVVSRLRQQFAVEIPMRVIFDQSSIAGLAVAVERARETAPLADDFQVARVSREAYRM